MKIIEKNHSALLDAFGLEPGQKVLFAHAHPDDEAVATAEAIHRSVDAGLIVHTALATDGTESTLGDPNLVENGWRRLEAMRALVLAGVPIHRQHYFGFTDGQLAAKHPHLARRLAGIIIENEIAAVFTPGQEGFDGHPDHIAVHRAAVDAAQLILWTPQVWGLNRSQGQVGLAVDSAQKLRVVGEHATQFPGASDQEMPVSTALQISAYEDLVYGTEWYNPVPI